MIIHGHSDAHDMLCVWGPFDVGQLYKRVDQPIRATWRTAREKQYSETCLSAKLCKQHSVLEMIVLPVSLESNTGCESSTKRYCNSFLQEGRDAASLSHLLLDRR